MPPRRIRQPPTRRGEVGARSDHRRVRALRAAVASAPLLPSGNGPRSRHATRPLHEGEEDPRDPRSLVAADDGRPGRRVRRGTVRARHGKGRRGRGARPRVDDDEHGAEPDGNTAPGSRRTRLPVQRPFSASCQHWRVCRIERSSGGLADARRRRSDRPRPCPRLRPDPRAKRTPATSSGPGGARVNRPSRPSSNARRLSPTCTTVSSDRSTRVC